MLCDLIYRSNLPRCLGNFLQSELSALQYHIIFLKEQKIIVISIFVLTW